MCDFEFQDCDGDYDGDMCTRCERMACKKCSSGFRRVMSTGHDDYFQRLCPECLRARRQAEREAAQKNARGRVCTTCKGPADMKCDEELLHDCGEPGSHYYCAQCLREHYADTM